MTSDDLTGSVQCEHCGTVLTVDINHLRDVPFIRCHSCDELHDLSMEDRVNALTEIVADLVDALAAKEPTQ